ncbi:hypothetical protein GCM10025789_14340 [Tessaracoccus lubricantis]|uniref:Band 7 domain-containing protein n=1 Tax=Tessaracoccus lubricantis TaxID=545543 RepID=A0ABP9FDH6_9ACTN
MYSTWQPVPLGEKWGEVAPGSVLLYTDEAAVVVDARRSSGKLKLRIQRPDGERFEREVKGGQTLRSQGKALLESDDVRAMMLPAVIWHEDKLFSPRNMVALLASAVVTTLLVVLLGMGAGVGSFLYLVFMASGATAMGVRRLWKGGRVSFLAPDRLGLTMGTIHAYALTREQGRLWVPPSPGADRRGLARQRVAAIREACLQLREDIVYRIESPALFDPKVPATAEFEASLVAFDDADDLTPTDALDALAAEAEVTFNVAQANAERLGLEHFPEEARADARRAGKAARLAAGAATEGERQASLGQVRRILDSLALYYLPTIDEKLAIER